MNDLKTAKIVIEAEPDLVEAILTAIKPVLDIPDAGRNNRLKLNPNKVRRTLRARPRPSLGESRPGDEGLSHITDLANAAGAQGIWLIRGATDAHLIYNPTEEIKPEIPAIRTNVSINFHIADAALLIVMRFPAGDGGEPGIE